MRYQWRQGPARHRGAQVQMRRIRWGKGWRGADGYRAGWIRLTQGQIWFAWVLVSVQAGAGEGQDPAQRQPTGQSLPPTEPAVPGTAPAPPTGFPRGTIVAFLPDFGGGLYSDPKGLRRWLAAQGWAICDGTDGTPDLHNRMLMGTERPEDAGQQIGSRNHDHRVSGNTDDAYGRNRDFPTGRGYSVRIPEDSHRHTIQGQTDRVEHIPPSTQVVFIIKTR